MITRSIRQSMRHPEGQALVLACLMMLVVTIAVLTTVHIGHSVHERIRLQNTVDASAFSSAAAEARAFNYYAFSNRTQASHYVSAMVWQSINSFAYFGEAFITDSFGLMLSLSPCADPSLPLKLLCEAVERLPYVGPVLTFINESFDAIHGAVKGFQDGLKALNVDFLISSTIRRHRNFNQFLMMASNGVMLATLTKVASFSSDIVKANDPNLSSLATGAAFGVLSACMLDRAHFREAGGSPLSPMFGGTLEPKETQEDSRIARAKRAMAQVANASRFACDAAGDSSCPETFATNRSLSAVNPLGFLGPAVQFFEGGVSKVGQTRMLSFQLGKGTNSGVPDGFAGSPSFGAKETANNHIRTYNTPGNHPVGAIAQGDVIGSDDLYWLHLYGLPLPLLKCGKNDDPRYCFGDNRVGNNDDYSRMVKTSIWSMSKDDLFPNGRHYKLVRPGRRPNGQYHEYSDIGLNLREELGGLVKVFAANIRHDKDDDNHRWDGLTPFNHFEPGEFADACALTAPGRNGDPSSQRHAARKDEFNQPSTFALLSKSPDELQNPEPDPTGATRAGAARLNPEGEISVSLAGKTERLEFDDEVPTLVLGRGMHALSRGQTYYHRPGNWAEQPNFFNPYWRPRLAPVLQARHHVPFLDEAINLLGPLGNEPQRFITH